MKQKHLHTLLLGSNSTSRQRLLSEARIPFTIVGHTADEAACEVAGKTFQQLVESIALAKMEHVNLSSVVIREPVCFVLTADTLCLTGDGQVQGKPIDRDDAIAKIKAARGGASVGTAFCLDRRELVGSTWTVVKRIQKFVCTDYVFNVPDAWLDAYLHDSPGLHAAGAIFVENFGDQFLQVVHGSYSNIIGLPMYELRCALEEIGFFEL